MNSVTKAQAMIGLLKSGLYLLGGNPIELLGLIAIYDERKPASPSEYWWQIDEPDLLAQLHPEL